MNQLMVRPRWDLLCLAFVMMASVLLICVCDNIDNIDHLLQLLLEYRWDLLSYAFIMMASICYICLIASNVKTQILVLSVSFLGFCWILNQEDLSYHILLLSAEEDDLGKDGYLYLSDHLSNKQVLHFLSPEEHDKRLTNNRARFYLALIAAHRKLQINPKGVFREPRFFGKNGINDLSFRLTYPINYADFCMVVYSEPQQNPEE